MFSNKILHLFFLLLFLFALQIIIMLLAYYLISNNNYLLLKKNYFSLKEAIIDYFKDISHVYDEIKFKPTNIINLRNKFYLFIIIYPFASFIFFYYKSKDMKKNFGYIIEYFLPENFKCNLFIGMDPDIDLDDPYYPFISTFFHLYKENITGNKEFFNIHLAIILGFFTLLIAVWLYKLLAKSIHFLNLMFFFFWKKKRSLLKTYYGYIEKLMKFVGYKWVTIVIFIPEHIFITIVFAMKLLFMFYVIIVIIAAIAILFYNIYIFIKYILEIIKKDFIKNPVLTIYIGFLIILNFLPLLNSSGTYRDFVIFIIGFCPEHNVTSSSIIFLQNILPALLIIHFLSKKTFEQKVDFVNRVIKFILLLLPFIIILLLDKFGVWGLWSHIINNNNEFKTWNFNGFALVRLSIFTTFSSIPYLLLYLLIDRVNIKSFSIYSLKKLILYFKRNYSPVMIFIIIIFYTLILVSSVYCMYLYNIQLIPVWFKYDGDFIKINTFNMPSFKDFLNN